MKKIILWTAIILVALIPTYVLVFQAIKSAQPDVNFAGAPIDSAAYRWVTFDSSGNVDLTSRSEKSMEKDFWRSTPIVLKNLDELSALSFSRQPSSVNIVMYDLTKSPSDFEDGIVKPYAVVSLSDIQAGKAPDVTVKTQALVGIEWLISSRIHIQAMYSFEVQP